MSNNNKKPVHWLMTRFFLGFVFSILFLVSLILTVALVAIISLAVLGLIFGANGDLPDTKGLGELLISCTAYFWNAIGDCVEDKPIGTNMKQKKDEIGWFFRVLSEQANNEQSLSIKITKYVLGILISCACLAGSGFAGYLFFNTLISGTLALSLGLILSLGATVGLGFGILLMIAEIYKIVKSVQKHLIHKEAEVKFDQMVKDDKISDFINEKTSKEKNRKSLTELLSGKHSDIKLEKKDKIKIFALIDKYGVENTKNEINEILTRYQGQK